MKIASLFLVLSIVMPTLSYAKTTTCVLAEGGSESAKYAFVTTVGKKMIVDTAAINDRYRATKSYDCVKETPNYSCIIIDPWKNNSDQPYIEAAFNGHAFAMQFGEQPVQSFICE